MIRSAPTLTPNEQSRLKQCEIAIERGLNTFVEVGRALAEIRDARLYRIDFKTFESYCKERWEIGRSRAYELIDQAKVVTAIADAGVNLSAVADISKRDVRIVKDDLPAVTAEIQTRVEQGENPENAAKDAIRKAGDKAKADKAKQQSKNQALQAAGFEALPVEVRALGRGNLGRGGTGNPSSNALTQDDRIAELEQANEFLEQRVSELEAKVKTFERLEPMYRDWIEGGWDRVVEAKDETIAEIQRTATARISSESHEKVRNLNAMRGLAKKLDEAGLGRNAIIDIETGEFVNG